MGKNRILKTPTYLSVFLCCFISGAFAQAATFTVNSPFDAADANPGDAMCETAPGNGVCTLRAAIEEANTLGARDDTIILPPNTYLLTLANELTITGADTALFEIRAYVNPTLGTLNRSRSDSRVGRIGVSSFPILESPPAASSRGL